MKEYEIVHQFFNGCAGEKYPTVNIYEAEIEDLDAYVKEQFRDVDFTYEKIQADDGSVVYHIQAVGLNQKMTFTEF